VAANPPGFGSERFSPTRSFWLPTLSVPYQLPARLDTDGVWAIDERAEMVSAAQTNAAIRKCLRMFISTPKDFQCLFDGQKWSAAYVAVDTLCENKKFRL